MSEIDDELVTHNTANPVKRPLPPIRIVMLSAILFFVGYGYAVNEGFGVPLLLEAGLEERYAPFALGISSIINVLLGGYLGSSSDRCTSSLGRRRPYIIALTVLLFFGAILYPYGDLLNDAFQLKHSSRTIYLVFHTAICVIIFDVCLDMTNTLDRSYLLDSITIQQTSHGNAMFSLMTSGGSFFGSLLAALDWEGYLHLSSGSQTKVVFATVLVVLLVCVTSTVNSVKEPKIQKDGKIDINNLEWKKCFICCNYFAFNLYDLQEKMKRSNQIKEISQSEENIPMITDENCLECKLNDPLPPKSSLQDLLKTKCCVFVKKFYTSACNAFYFLKSLSLDTFFLWLTQVLEWMTMLSLLFFITHFVGTIIYNGSPDEEPNSKSRREYRKGVRMGLFCQCIGFASSLIFSLFLYTKYSSKIKTRVFYVSIHVLTFLATGVLIFSESIYLVASLHVIFGCFYSWIQIIPFTLLQSYQVSLLQ